MANPARSLTLMIACLIMTTALSGCSILLDKLTEVKETDPQQASQAFVGALKNITPEKDTYFKTMTDIYITVTVLDQSNNPLPDALVTITDKEAYNITFIKDVTDENGAVSGFVTIRSGYPAIAIKAQSVDGLAALQDIVVSENTSTYNIQLKVSPVINSSAFRPLVEYPDSDNDGVPDAWDEYPFDPSRSFLQTTIYPHIISFEDLYPSSGDRDTNDLAAYIDINTKTAKKGYLKSISGTVKLKARGAKETYLSDFGIRFLLNNNIANAGNAASLGSARIEEYTSRNVLIRTQSVTIMNNSDLILPLFSNTGNKFGTDHGLINTFMNKPFNPGGQVLFSVTFEDPMNLKTSLYEMYDPYLKITNFQGTIYDIHRPFFNPLPNSADPTTGQASKFIDDNNFPFCVMIPMSTWFWPLETVDISLSYPDIFNWVNSNFKNSQQWYTDPDINLVYTKSQ
ncbi:MAG: hypothetical protein DKM50_08720 [Candidatus Margulisiibacteriota bacterium]|nr:MAG: hypothetical protein A2X43_11725 [Candidatus Margulisbacteria bacterium GWD2_39_127]PZM79532.1 MAG: hypothetical protein DKM50_08720 [Candidatus Margulisiibacteriota bacterium]HAR63795.1 hypothetical protein [Candidatus Margulisiibacteriota bacterium]HCY37793.1 hypothetical protein [Candidatus Margulisiibacteriota bacterium]